MARHREGRPGSAAYTELPVLDEVVDLGTRREDLPVLSELAQDVHASVLTQLQPVFDQLIEARLKGRLEPLLEGMFNDLRADLQRIAREILSDAINHAIEKELDRRKSGG